MAVATAASLVFTAASGGRAPVAVTAYALAMAVALTVAAVSNSRALRVLTPVRSANVR